MNPTARRLPASVLSACLLGLAACPFAFIAIGALSQFPLVFRMVMLPPLLLGCSFLLRRYLAKPSELPPPRRARLTIETLSWVAVAVFLFFISDISLATTFERAGAVSTAFLAASAVFLPVTLLRRTDIERRVGQLPRRLVLTLVIATLAAASAASVIYLWTPAAFI